MGDASVWDLTVFLGLIFFMGYCSSFFGWLTIEQMRAPPKIIRPNKTKTSVETFDHLLHIVHKVLISYQCVPGENFQALFLILSVLWCHTSLAEDFPKYPSLWAYPCRAARPQVPPCPNEPLLLMTKQLAGLLQDGPPEHLFSNFIKRIPGMLYTSLCSFYSNPWQSLACISLLPIQDSRFSFLSLMVLMTLRLEVLHLPRTTLLHIIFVTNKLVS